MIIAWTWWYRYYYRLMTVYGLVIAPLGPSHWDCLTGLPSPYDTHAAIYDYRLKTWVISILFIALTHAAIVLSPRTWWYHYYYRLDTRRGVIIALNLVISYYYRLDTRRNLWLSPRTW
jgi:hypothetical protein